MQKTRRIVKKKHGKYRWFFINEQFAARGATPR